jgi:hypothetical protein
VITDQVTNGIAMRMSVLYLMLGSDASRSVEAERDDAQPAAELEGASVA